MTTSEVIEEIRVRLARAVPPNSRVVLFGSHARGEADDGSDFDLLVIEPDVPDSVAEAIRLRRELRGLRAPIDVVVGDDLARRRGAVNGTMVERALREGRERLFTPEAREVATLLVRKAGSDLAAARTLASDPDQLDDVIGFHAQQARSSGRAA